MEKNTFNTVTYIVIKEVDGSKFPVCYKENHFSLMYVCVLLVEISFFPFLFDH